jgi:transposase-like protein
MIEHNSTLNNFFGGTVQQYQTQIKIKLETEKRFSINRFGKFHEVNPVCPCCGSTCIVHNGNDKCKSKVIRELGLVIKKGKFKCKRCGNTWTTKYEDANLFVEQYKQLICTEIFSLCTFDVSLDRITEHILSIYGKTISHEWVRQLYINAAKEIEKKKVLKTSGIFHYDEQYLEVNGKKYVRIVVLDAVTKEVIFDEKVENTKIETLKDALNLRMLPYKKEAFIVDLAKGYPKILKELFPDVKIQWCIFHLNQLIIHDFGGSKKLSTYGRKTLPLQELYNLYLMLNLFLDHEVEIRFLKRQLKKLSEIKEMLKGCRCYVNSSIVSSYEMKLISEFKEFRKSLKKHRRKYPYKYLLRRNKKETLKILEKLEREIGFFPEKIQKRIKMIRENIDKLTLFQENPLVPPTNNTLEQYYSATLQKTKKKRFRSNLSLDLKLKIVRERWNKTLEYLQFNFMNFLQLFARIFYFFTPT